MFITYINYRWLRCNDKWSPIKTLFPSCLWRIGSINVKNQSVKMVSSNHPLFDRLYLAPGGPAATHWEYRCTDLQATYGGTTSPSAFPQNITENAALLESILLSGYFVPHFMTCFLAPGSSLRFVSTWFQILHGAASFNSFCMLSKYCFNCSLLIDALFRLMFVAILFVSPLRFIKPRAQSSRGILFVNFFTVRFCLVRYAAIIILMSNLSKGKPQSHHVTTRDANNSSSTSLKTVSGPADSVWMFLSLFWVVSRGIPYCSDALFMGKAAGSTASIHNWSDPSE